MSWPRVASARAHDVPWNNVLAAFTVLSALVSIIFILDYTKYPDAVWRLLAFQYLLRDQDVAGSTLIVAIALGAWLLRKRNLAFDPARLVGRHPWLTAGLVFAGLCLAMLTVVHNHPLAGDEHLAVFQSRVFAAGKLSAELPADLLSRLIPVTYQVRWLVASESGHVASVYWPGFALLLAPFSLAGVPWACNPLLAALSLVLVGRLASRLTSDERAGGWAMLLAVASPGFLGMALSYFSMTAHLFLNLLFAWLLTDRNGPRVVAAGIVGSFALVQSNPVPHLLFALPWIVWLARQSGARRNLTTLALAYAPISLLVGLGWWLFLRELQGSPPALPYAPDGNPLHRGANLLWYLLLELRAVFTVPGTETFAKRLAEQVRLWSWAVPGLPLLALAGWWLQRRVVGLRLLGLSLVSTLLGFCFVSFDQGYGWGARYVHSAWGALPILAAAVMVSVRSDERAQQLWNYGLRAAAYSLVFGTALRLFQIHLFMHDQLALRPPFEEGVPQIVFIPNNWEFYTQDFLQNDPFLRDPVVFMGSRGPARDYREVIARRFPEARLTYEGPDGQVWRLR